jgi:hypothetical protein
MDEVVHLLPTRSTWRSHTSVGAIAETNDFMPTCPQRLHVSRTILNVDVCTYLVLFLHKAQIYVGNSMVVQPTYGLAYGGLMEVKHEKTMRNDSNASAFVGKKPKVLSSSRDHRRGLE